MVENTGKLYVTVAEVTLLIIKAIFDLNVINLLQPKHNKSQFTNDLVELLI